MLGLAGGGFSLVLLLFFCSAGCKSISPKDNGSTFLKASKMMHNAHRKNHTMPPKGCKYFYKISKEVESVFELKTMDVKRMSIIESHDIITGTSHITFIINELELNLSYKNGILNEKETTYFPVEIVKGLKNGVLSCDLKCKPVIYENEVGYIALYSNTGSMETVSTISCIWDNLIIK